MGFFDKFVKIVSKKLTVQKLDFQYSIVRFFFVKTIILRSKWMWKKAYYCRYSAIP